ncbi:VanZ family protein [Lactobacillus halodurans]|uniref:VanZ family protein n=2 Tax=Companilactobacillus halodurans TaxID=2584183 RepID=A0A5P0ZM03_9LACO|nr:VanZ family protein [Companilactobacillus halodurans]MQS75212.1 VanZ family protein [Companilactobacillus halodurans]
MRFIPLLFILIISIFAGLYIIKNISKFTDRHFDLISLVYLIFLGMILFSPISFDGLSVYLMPAGIGHVNLHELDIFEIGFMENIILTVPLGLLIKRSFPQISIISMAILGFFIGGGIETTQYYLSHIFLINRTSDINDVIANGIGIVIGAILMITYELLTNRKVFSESRQR